MIRIQIYLSVLFLVSCGMDDKAVKKTKAVSGTHSENLRSTQDTSENNSAEALPSNQEASAVDSGLPDTKIESTLSLEDLIRSEKELMALETRLAELKATQETNVDQFSDQIAAPSSKDAKTPGEEGTQSSDLEVLREQLSVRLDLFRGIFDTIMKDIDGDQLSHDKKIFQAQTLADSLLSQIIQIKNISNQPDGSLEQIKSLVETIQKDLSQLPENSEDTPNQLLPILEHLEGAAHIALPILKIFI